VHDLLVLGSGIAGLTAARHAAERGLSVLVLTKGDLDWSATSYAQGGVAAALAPPDSPELHLRDTLAAGVGLCDLDAVRLLVEEGPARVRELAALGARFDAAAPGAEADDVAWHLTREGGHSLARVVHAGGDATGAEIERALVSAVEHVPVEVREGWFVLDILVEQGRCAGVVALDPQARAVDVRAADTVLATGGVGQCFAVTTNPVVSTGDGLAAALRAGVACADLEFVQFHPTALAIDVMPRPLISEALRGEGAVLRDAAGVAFMRDEHPLGDLAPRDVVSRAVHRRMRAGGHDHVWLDATGIAAFADRFPTIHASCRAVGLDPTVDWLPVAPAAHYHSGGVLTDLDGATTLPRLWACGEVACAGVHGANRLASNSLLDGLVFGHRVVDAVFAGKQVAEPTGALEGVADVLAPGPVAPPLPAGGSGDVLALRRSVQRTMSAECGVVRDARGLRTAAETLAVVAGAAAGLAPRAPESHEVRNLAAVSRAIVAAAAARRESRGSHTRADHPATAAALAGRFVVWGGGDPRFVPLPERSLEPTT
jgi:L-aspartate oxidase